MIARRRGCSGRGKWWYWASWTRLVRWILVAKFGCLKASETDHWVFEHCFPQGELVATAVGCRCDCWQMPWWGADFGGNETGFTLAVHMIWSAIAYFQKRDLFQMYLKNCDNPQSGVVHMDDYIVKKTLSMTPRPLYCWKAAETVSFLCVLLVCGVKLSLLNKRH